MIIQRDRSIIPACDVSIEKFVDIVKKTGNLEKVGGYKIPATAGREGWEIWVKTARKYTDKPLIYDHQKAGTDIPDTGENFMKAIKGAGFDAVILFPQSGPVVEYEWIRAAQDKGLGVIVGGEMTHLRYLSSDINDKGSKYSEIFHDLIGFEKILRGYIRDDAPDDIYKLAAKMGVSDFVVPGNKPDRIAHYKLIIEDSGIKEPIFYSPGLIAQGGQISNGAKAAGRRFHGIVGRGIYNAKNIREAALELTSQL